MFVQANFTFFYFFKKNLTKITHCPLEETSDIINTPILSPSSSDTDTDGSDRNTPEEMETTTASPEVGFETDGAGDDATCFPWDAKVYLERGYWVTMAQLRVGDRVQVSSKEFSEVFVFTHRDRHNTAARYVELRTSGNISVTMTDSHLVHVFGGTRKASECRSGDNILTVFGWQVITSVRDVAATGLYNPQTLQGDIVVNGVVASTFTTAVQMRAANGLLSPLRALYRVGWACETFWDTVFSSSWMRHEVGA